VILPAMTNFVDELAPGSDQTWRDICQGAEPRQDNSGYLVGPWGDAIRAAVAYEQQNPNWQENFPDGPAGNVINLLNEIGHEGSVDTASRTEEACRSGNLPLEQVAPAVMQGQVVPPPQQMMDGMSPKMQELEGLVGNSTKLVVEQSLSLLEAFTGGICETNNQYRVSNEQGEDIMHAREEANGCARCCCAPHHSTKVYITNTKTNETILTIEREGMEFPCPKKCLGNQMVCMDCCADAIKVYEGRVEGEPGDMLGAPEPLVMIKQPICGGGFTPTLNVFPKGQEEADFSHQITGPTCFGGCSELCCKSSFEYKSADGQDVGKIVHMTPGDIGEVCEAICTDVDKFELQFTQAATPQDKATALASSLLVDYMFFEMDNGMVKCKDGGLEFTCCFMYCCGALCPCKISCGGKKPGEEGGKE